jgi:FMN reductase
MSIAIVVGNPKARSRTYDAAAIVAERLSGRPADVTIDLVDFGAALLDWTDQGVADAISQLKAAELVVFASPTYKASYTGLLKIFLDRISGGALAGVTAVPLMLGGHWRHSRFWSSSARPARRGGCSCSTASIRNPKNSIPG